MRRAPILHPILFSLYPAIAFLAHNFEQTRPIQSLRTLIISVAGAAVIYLILKMVMHDPAKAGIGASIIAVLFFSYGHIYNALEGMPVFGVTLGRHRLLAVLWLSLAVFAIWGLLRYKGKLPTITTRLNFIAGFLLLIPVVQIGYYLLSTPPSPAVQTAEPNTALRPGNDTPDIYYIILDSYSRDDMLRRFYGLDNAPFLEELEQMGFYIATCAQSNYGQSELSMSSSLNYDYLDALGEQFRPPNTRRAGLSELIQHSAARRDLESIGYKVISLDSGYDPTRLTDADVYFAHQGSADINDFEEIFLRTTAARLLSEGVTLLNIPPDWENRDQAHRERILWELEQLNKIPSIPGPKFVFAHIITPHWPYVFGPNGEPVHERPESETGYRNQVIFINDRIIPILQNILEKSSTPPVIIIQGDHGAVLEDPQRRMSILNAYYLPNGGNELLYEGVSPVNSFRVIFNYYFDAEFNLLDDVSYYSTYEEPYNYQVIENTRQGCKP